MDWLPTATSQRDADTATREAATTGETDATEEDNPPRARTAQAN